jgi:hypothetical protein
VQEARTPTPLDAGASGSGKTELMAAERVARLDEGTLFSSMHGTRHGRVRGFLGEGGQGSVYEVEIEGASFALKWYHEYYTKLDVTLRERLTWAVERGAPDDNFLWPLDLVEIRGRREFGYVMPLRQHHFNGMRDLIAAPPRRVELSLEQRMVLCLRLAQSFLELHASGFCYQDISFGNIFFDPKTVDILICDNDNVNIDGAAASIYGTRKFMAPEVVRRETLPNTRSDLFSMVVLFFYTLVGWHPLDGKREAEIHVLDAQSEMSLYGTHPVFLFDPVDSSNGPVPGLHDPLVVRWKSLPSYLRRLFIQSFSEGLGPSGARVLEHEWRSAFALAHSGVMACKACGYEHVVESGPDGVLGPRTCLACAAPMVMPPVLAIGRHLFAASPGRIVPAYLMAGGRAPEFAQVGGVIETHPVNLAIVGLRNRTAASWQASRPGYPPIDVPPGKAVTLVHGMTIAFGQATGRVVHSSSNQPTAE